VKIVRAFATCAVIAAGLTGAAALAAAQDAPPGAHRARVLSADRLDAVIPQPAEPGPVQSLAALRAHPHPDGERHVPPGTASAERMTWALGAGLVLCVAAGIAATVTVERTVVSPLDRAARMLEAITERDADLARPLDVRGRDDVGEAARSLSVVIGKMQDAVGRVTQATAQASTAAGHVAAVTRDVVRGATDHASSLARLASDTETLAARGDGLALFVGRSRPDEGRLSPHARDLERAAPGGLAG
jgi:methyl-accepting chemotaxis protein